MGFYSWWAYMHSDPSQKPKVSWALIQRALRYAQPYRWQIVGMLITILLTTGLGLLTPLILADLIDRALPSRDFNRLLWLSLALIGIPLGSGLINILNRQLNATIGEGVIYDLRVSLYSHLQHMSLRFFTHTRTGELMSRLNNDVVGAQNAISNTIVGIITSVIQALAILVVMFAIEWRLTAISIAVFPLFVLTARRIGERLREIARGRMHLDAQMSATMNETLNVGGVLLVKLFGRMANEIDRFKGRAAGVRDKGVEQAIVGRILFVIIGLISAFGTALTFGMGGYLVLEGAMSIGAIVAFSTYLGQLYGTLQSLANAPVEFATSLVSFERVFEVLDLPVDIIEKSDAYQLDGVKGGLEFRHVTFAYKLDDRMLLSSVERIEDIDNITASLTHEDGQKIDMTGLDTGAPSQARETALVDINFSIEPGQLVALVGPSGAGKTTLTYLIPRLYDPTGGSVLIDGHDLRNVRMASLAEQVGMVTQETHLFHDTILANLLYARTGATREAIVEAAQAANIHDFIVGLPDGYDTIVGERGYRLSGGEKQRLALARVILKNPRVLVLDEATSHLDSESEALIQEALKRVMAGRTSIVIAHRLSTILAADQILVMDRGEIVEQGTHAELLDRGGLYARLYETQFSREEMVLVE